MERPLIEANPQVEVFGAYYRERAMLARDRDRDRDRDRGPVPESLAALKRKPVAVSGPSLAGWLLAGAEGGMLRESLSTQHADGVAAARALAAGQVAAAAGLASELEATLAGQPRYAIVALPTPRAPRAGWVVGCAVKRGSTDLAQAIQPSLTEMTTGPALREMFGRHGVTWRS